MPFAPSKPVPPDYLPQVIENHCALKDWQAASLGRACLAGFLPALIYPPLPPIPIALSKPVAPDYLIQVIENHFFL